MQALRKANRVRFGMGEVKRSIFIGEMTVAEALDDQRAGSLSVNDLLAAQRRWGVVRVERALWRLGERLAGPCSPPFNGFKRVRELTSRERSAVEEIAA